MRPWSRACWVVVLLVVTSGSVAAVGPAEAVPPAATAIAEPATGADDPHAPLDLAAADSVPHTRPPTDAAYTQTSSDRTIELRQELRLTPDRPGEYDAHHRYRIPDGVLELSVRLPPGATASSSTGFDYEGEGTYVWDGSTTRPTLTYRVPANRTVDRDDPIAGAGQYMYVDVGRWALVLRPQVAHDWAWLGGGEVGMDGRLAVDGDGAAGEAIAFLGPHETYTRTAHGQTFRLVVPEAATLEEDPEAILASLVHASDALRVGSRDREVFVVAAPTGDVGWGLRGLQTADADVWVLDAEPLDSADNVWLHEYVHTRQVYTAADDLRWFTEGSAVFYAALLALEQGWIDFEAFDRRLATGTDARFDGVHLADRRTWRGHPDYHVGALVAGELDLQLRRSTGSERSLQDTLRRLNEEPGTVDAERFLALLRADGGDAVAELGADYTRTAARPDGWDAAEHAAVFGTPLARIETSVQPNLRVDGPYRSGTLGAPAEVVPGETLAVGVRVHNDGERSGDYDVAFRVDGVERDRLTGRLDPGESADVAFDHRFEAVGEHVVAVGGTRVPVRVVEPARATVTDLSVDRTAVEPGENVTLTIAVANEADRPGRLDVPVTRDGGEVAREDVRLGPGERRTATVRLTLSEPGEHVIGLGGADDRTVVVTASGPLWEELPGFGIGAALLALLLLVLGRARRA